MQQYIVIDYYFLTLESENPLFESEIERLKVNLMVSQ